MNKQKLIKEMQRLADHFKCRYCSESGCDDGEYHDKKLIAKVIEETLKRMK